MCGRYATTRTSVDLSQLFGAFDETDEALAPDYNLAPTDPAPIIRMTESAADSPAPQRVVSVARWGLLPSWADSPRAGARMINARAETAATTRAFAPSFAGRRCLVPADGWFEWVAKKAFYMTRPGGFAFAGLWTQSSRYGLSCSIVTTAALGELTRVHHRMPLLLAADRWEEWLTAPADPGLLTPTDLAFVNSIEIRPVGPAIGNVRSDGPDLITRVDPVADLIEQETLF